MYCGMVGISTAWCINIIGIALSTAARGLLICRNTEAVALFGGMDLNLAALEGSVSIALVR